MKCSTVAITEDTHIKLKIYCATHGNVKMKDAVQKIIGDFLAETIKKEGE